MTVAGAVRRIAGVLRTVPDLAAAEAFYREALGFRTLDAARDLGPEEAALLDAPGTRVSLLTMRLGGQAIGFLRFEPGGRPYPAGSAASDLWFQHCAVVTADMDEAFRTVAAHPITPISLGGPQRLPLNDGGVRAFKFRDPFGHPLELLWFPPGVGDPAWHAGEGALFRGIDHSAIAVSDADGSLRFYRDVLGFAALDRTRNRGVEQDRLDGLDHADVDVLALQPAVAPPHLELLGYRTGPRRMLGNVGAADASLSRTLAVVDDPAGLSAFLSGVPTASGPRRGRWQGRDAVAFGDPAGHGWVCVAPG